MLMELAGLLVMGDLPSWTKRELARRWCCHRDTVNKVATQLSGHYNNTERPLDSSYAATLRECFPHLAAASRPEAATERPKVTDTRASSSESKRKKERENNTSDKPTMVDEVWSKLESIRAEHSKVTRSWPTTGKTATTRRKAIARGLKDLRSDGHEDPVQTLLDTVRWMFTSDNPKAQGCKRSSGIDSILRPSNLCAAAMLVGQDTPDESPSRKSVAEILGAEPQPPAWETARGQ